MIYLEKLEEAKRGRCWKGFKPRPGSQPYSKGSCVKESRLNPDNRNPLIEAYMSLFLEGGKRKTKKQKNRTQARREGGEEYQDKQEVLNPVRSSDAARIEKGKFGEVDKEGQEQKKSEIRGRLRTAAGQLGQVDQDKLAKLKARLQTGQGAAKKTSFTSPEAAAERREAEAKAAAAERAEARKRSEDLRKKELEQARERGVEQGATTAARSFSDTLAAQEAERARQLKMARRRGGLEQLARLQRRRRAQTNNSPASEPEATPTPEPKPEATPAPKPEPKPKPKKTSSLFTKLGTKAMRLSGRVATAPIRPRNLRRLSGAIRKATPAVLSSDLQGITAALASARRDRDFRKIDRLEKRLQQLQAERGEEQ